jgi:hypothetical protein
MALTPDTEGYTWRVRVRDVSEPKTIWKKTSHPIASARELKRYSRVVEWLGVHGAEFCGPDLVRRVILPIL